jgi:hypothetical protein
MGTKERLMICAELLATIDRNRAFTGDNSVAVGIEQRIIERELRELEREILADPGALEAIFVKDRRRKNESPF